MTRRTATRGGESLSLAEQLLGELHADYCVNHPEVSFDEFVTRMRAGLVLVADLDLSEPLQLLAAMDRPIRQDPGAEDGPRVIRTAGFQRAIDALCSLSVRDGLTGLFNRRYFDHRLAQELDRSRREQRPCSLAMVDIDDFKSVNDTYGHDVGDDVLRLVANTLAGNLRASDEAARFGGEEFAVILPGTDIRDAVRVGDRLRLEVAKASREIPSGPISLSLGVATSRQLFCIPGEQLIKQADIALYRAKEQGKNRVVPFSDPKPTGEVSKQEREALLR